MNIIDFEMTTLANCSDHGIYLSGPGQTTVLNIIISNVSVGVGLNSPRGNLEIRSSNIVNASQAINIHFTDSNNAGNITIENCNISDCEKGIELHSVNYLTDNSIIVSRNTFTNVSSSALSVMHSTYYYYRYVNVNRSITVDLNVLRNSCGIHLETWNSGYISFKDNVITDSICYNSNECYITSNSNGNNYATTRQIDLSTNLIQNISAPCIVHLKSENSESEVLGSFLYNQLLANRATKGVVLVESKRFSICRNVFDNPASSFDVYTEVKGRLAQITVFSKKSSLHPTY